MMLRIWLILCVALLFSACKTDPENNQKYTEQEETAGTIDYSILRFCKSNISTCDPLKITLSNEFIRFPDLEVDFIKKYKERYLFYQKDLKNFGASNFLTNIFVDKKDISTCFFIRESSAIVMNQGSLDLLAKSHGTLIQNRYGGSSKLIDKELKSENGVRYMKVKYQIESDELYYFTLIKILNIEGSFEGVLYSKDEKEDVYDIKEN